MNRHYLVDYENVYEHGLSGIGELPEDDRVYIFHTSGKDKISLSVMNGLQARLTAFSVPAGDQSLDMNLASYLGFLLGRETDPDDRYFIVSRDADYYSVALTWNNCYRMPDKITCVPAVDATPGNSFRKYNNSPDYLYEERPITKKYPYEEAALREEILHIFDQYGEVTANGAERIRFSVLCACLNQHRYFENLRAFYKLKPIGLMENYFSDLLRLKREKTDIWVYLLPGPYHWEVEEDHVETAEEIGDEATNAGKPDESDESDVLFSEEELDLEQLSVLADDPEAEADPGCEAAEDKCEIEPIPDMNPIETENAAGADPADQVENMEEQEAAPEEAIRAAIREYMLSRAEQDSSSSPPSVRASALRDYLIRHTPFSDLQRASGKTPLQYLTEEYADLLQHWKQQGSVWVSLKEEAGGGNSGLHEKSGKESVFLTQDQIMEKLTGGGMNPAVARAVTDCYMLASGGNTLKGSLYDSLDRTYGRKVGRFYYRDAVRILGL